MKFSQIAPVHVLEKDILQQKKSMVHVFEKESFLLKISLIKYYFLNKEWILTWGAGKLEWEAAHLDHACSTCQRVIDVEFWGPEVRVIKYCLKFRTLYFPIWDCDIFCHFQSRSKFSLLQNHVWLDNEWYTVCFFR